MAAGKFVLLLMGGGLAGAAFAALTTGAITRLPDAQESLSPPPVAQPDAGSDSDEGAFVLGTAQWPFQAEGGADGLAYSPEDLEAPDYEPGPAAEDNRPFAYHAGEPPKRMSQPMPSARPVPPPTGRVGGAGDAATAAANRAADAAQDVLAAETAL